jgi:hypothetical protein
MSDAVTAASQLDSTTELSALIEQCKSAISDAKARVDAAAAALR